MNHETALGADTLAFIEHDRHCLVPFGQTVSVAAQIEAGDGHFARDDRMHCRPSVAHHQNEFGSRKQLR